MKLIDADALKQVTEESIAEYDDCYTRDTIFGMRSVVYYATADAPTIDAVPAKHGHWEEHKDYPGLAYLCSECGHFTTMRTPYCPICGARMNEE